MRIIEIAPLTNGAHRNQNGGLSVVPEGWAVIREGEDLPNFPFGSFEVETVDGVPYMKEGSWVPGVMPEPEPIPEPEQPVDEIWDELDAAYQEGVDSV